MIFSVHEDFPVPPLWFPKPALNHCRSSETLAAAMLGYGSSSLGSTFGTLSKNDVNSRVIQNLIHIQKKNCQPEWITLKESPTGSQLTNLFPEIPCLEDHATNPQYRFNLGFQSHKIFPSLFCHNLQKDRIKCFQEDCLMIFSTIFSRFLTFLSYLPPRH